jgi:hypothetical protein
VPVRPLHYGRDVHDVGAAEQHVRESNDQRLIVYRIEEPFGPHAEVGFGGNERELEAERLVRAVEVNHRGEVHCGTDDLPAASLRQK